MTNGASRFAHLQNQARANHQNVSELVRLYVLEGMLARIAVSAYSEDFVLKGGVLLAAFALRRPTKDIDLEATRLNNEQDDVLYRVQEIAATSLDDGIEFDLGSIRALTIRDGDGYQGVRVKLTGIVGRSQNVIGLDVSFGDPIWPAPQRVDIPRVLDDDVAPAISMLGYPLAMVVAEKVVTMIQRGEANTRWRDFADVVALAARHPMREVDLRSSLDVVAAHRQAVLEPLGPALINMPVLAQPKWATWRNNQEHREVIPELFQNALNQASALIDPLIGADVLERTLEPSAGLWLEP